MKTDKSFGEFMLNAWASILRVLFPRYCVQCLTLKTRKHAEKFLPGGEKEHKILDENLDAQFIKARRWSLTTRVALLAAGVKSLASDACTEEELLAAYRSGDLALLIAVMRVYTPSRKVMLTFLQEKDSTFMAAIASQVPSAFASLKPWEILGIGEGEAPAVTSPRWEIAKSLVGVCPNWAPLFMQEILKIANIKSTGANLFRFFFLNAIKGNEDISSFVLDIRRVFPESCAELRFTANAAYKHLGKCFCVLFPMIRKYLAEPHHIWAVPQNMELSDTQDAFAWLYRGLGLLARDRDVFACIFKELNALEKVLSKENLERIITVLVRNASNFGELNSLYKMTEEVETRGQIERRLAGMAWGLELHFPFKSWQKSDDIFTALDTLAERGMLPIDRLGELTPEQQAYAVAAMEAYSQISAIKSGRAGELVLLKPLQLKAEFFLLDSTDWKNKNLYNEHYKMAPASFRRIAKSSYNEHTEALICAYAKKWGLTKEQHYALMQSPYKGIAPLLENKITEA